MSSAAIQTTNYDDILALARPFAEKHESTSPSLSDREHRLAAFPGFAYEWIMELVRILKVTVDYSEEAHHDSLVRNNYLQLCLSILNHLGFQGEFRPRTFGGKFAVLALNIRNIVILITIASNTPVTLKQTLSPLDEHGKRLTSCLSPRRTKLQPLTSGGKNRGGRRARRLRPMVAKPALLADGQPV